MDRVLPTVTPPATVTDGFGQRTTGVDSETGEQVELLEFAPEIVEHTGFVTALAERVARFASVRHASYVHLRRLDRPAPDRLQLVSDLTPGWRLSEMLEESAAARIPIDITVVIALLRQLLPAVALFGRHNRENAIGALSPQRLIVTPQARLVIAEHAFGPAIEKLNLGRDKLWREFRVTMPPSAGLPRANPRADANAIGVVGLTLLLGRSLELDEFPSQLEALVENAQEHRDGQGSPLSASFKNWLKRALQFDVASAFQSPSEAQLAFESVLASDRSYVTTSPVFTNWVNEIGGTIDIKRRPVALASPEPEPQVEPAPEMASAGDDAPVIVLSNGQVAGEVPPEPEEVLAVPEPIEEIVAPEPVAAAATDAVEEIEIPLDELEAAAPIAQAESVVEEAAAPVEEAAVLAEPEPAPQPEPEPEPVVEAPRPAFTREQLEEDPIARQLLNYQPKIEPPPPVHEPEPIAEPDPVIEEVAEPEPVAEQVVEAPVAVYEEAVEEAPAMVEEEATVVEEEEVAGETPRYEPPVPVAARQAYEAPAPPIAQPHYEEPVSDAEPAVEEAPPAPETFETPETPATPYAAEVPYAPPPPSAPEAPSSKGPFGNPIVLGLAGVVVLLIAVMGWLLTRDAGGGMRDGEGELVVQSRPEGAQVKIDGEVKGTTPLTVRLDAGAHVMEVQSGKSEPRVIPLTITAGVQTSQYVELQGVAKTGALEIRSEPSGARITIDGRPRGTTPMTVGDLSPGDHTVVLEAGGRKVSQAIRIQAGTTAQLVVPMRR